MNDRDKILLDAKAASDGFGVETGQAALDEAHTPTSLSFNTGALYLDTAPFGSGVPGVAAGKQDQA